jgi:hypothetical protein
MLSRTIASVVAACSGPIKAACALGHISVAFGLNARPSIAK